MLSQTVCSEESIHHTVIGSLPVIIHCTFDIGQRPSEAAAKPARKTVWNFTSAILEGVIFSFFLNSGYGY